MPYEPVSFPVSKKDAKTGESPEEVCHDRVRGINHVRCVERLRELGLFILLKGRHRAV